MGAHCIRHTALPNTSKLFADYLYNFDRVAGFYDYEPWHPDSFARAAAAIDYPDERRAELAVALGALNPGSKLVDRIAQPGTVAVITGQQVGLLTGPAYTIYKALTAIKLAARLTEQGIPAVPIFWLATEDHDLAEINHAWLFDAGQHPFSISADGENAAQRPVGGIEVTGFDLEELRKGLADLPFAGEIVERVGAAYQPGRSYGETFRLLLKSLLGGLDILFADPLAPGIRRIAAPFLARAVRESAALKEKVLERNAALALAGYHSQVHLGPNTSLVFLLRDGRRVTLRESNGEFVTRDRRYSREELAAEAEHLSPNALLRPVTEDWIFPTISYIGGPAELAYLAQAQPLYHALLGRMPVMLPRAGFTLLDARATKLMARYKLTLGDIFPGEQPLGEHIGRMLVPESLSDTYEQVRLGVGAELDRLHQELARFDSTLVAALEKSRAKITWQLTKNEQKIAREVLRKNQRAQADAAFLSNQIYPHKHLQERLYSILPFLARHGMGLVEALYGAVEPQQPDHILFSI